MAYMGAGRCKVEFDGASSEASWDDSEHTEDEDSRGNGRDDSVVSENVSDVSDLEVSGDSF